MRADSFYSIGHTHKVCQDYALCGELENTWPNWVALSDGCSSSPHTDVGARLIVWAALKAVALTGNSHWFPDQFIQNVFKNSLVKENSLDATLLILEAPQDQDHIEAHIFGDGVVFALRNDDLIEAWQIEQADAPAYLSNLLTKDRLKRYLEKWGGKRVVNHYLDGTLVDSFRDEITVENSGWNFGFDIVLDRNEYQMVCVGSDGLDSFVDQDLNRVPLTDVLGQIANISNSNGTFLERNVGFFLKKKCPKLGWKNQDDVSVAGFWCKEE